MGGKAPFPTRADARVPLPRQSLGRGYEMSIRIDFVKSRSARLLFSKVYTAPRGGLKTIHNVLLSGVVPHRGQCRRAKGKQSLPDRIYQHMLTCVSCARCRTPRRTRWASRRTTRHHHTLYLRVVVKPSIVSCVPSRVSISLTSTLAFITKEIGAVPENMPRP